MQLQGETARILKARGFLNPVPQSLTAVVKTLGYSGLFTGARACLLRDIPFGAIYFPTYSFLKENLSNREGPSRSVSASNLLLAGTLAGMEMFAVFWLENGVVSESGVVNCCFVWRELTCDLCLSRAGVPSSLLTT